MANIINVMLSTHDEEKYHSRVLTWLIDPEGSHGLGRAFLDGFVELAFPGWRLGSIKQVQSEFRLREGDVPDLIVLAEGQLLVVENKTRFSSITEGQVERYLQAALEKAGEREVRLIFLLPGPRKSFSQLDYGSEKVAVVFWNDVANLLQEVIKTSIGHEKIVWSLQMYFDYIADGVAKGDQMVALPSGAPKFSRSRSGITSDFRTARSEFLSQAREACGENTARLDRINAFIGFLENLETLRIKYKRGNTHWNVTASIPRGDGGVTLIVQSYANGRICYEYRRLPEELGKEYQRLTFGESDKGWREVWIETLPLEQIFNAVRTIAQKASVIPLPPVQ